MPKSSDLFREFLRKELRTRENPYGKMTVLELQEASGVSAPQIYAYLDKKGSVPGLDHAERLAEALGADLAAVLGVETAPHTINDCIREVSSAALRGSHAPGSQKADTMGHLQREPTDLDVYWVFGHALKHHGGVEKLASVLESLKARKSKAK